MSSISLQNVKKCYGKDTVIENLNLEIKDNYFWPLIMTSKDAYRTLPIGISLLKDAETLQKWNIIMAGNLLLVLPMLGLYIAASKKIRNAFVYSGIK